MKSPSSISTSLTLIFLQFTHDKIWDQRSTRCYQCSCYVVCLDCRYMCIYKLIKSISFVITVIFIKVIHTHQHLNQINSQNRQIQLQKIIPPSNKRSTKPCMKQTLTPLLCAQFNPSWRGIFVCVICVTNWWKWYKWSISLS